jgi:hypothetical protein
MLTFADPRWLAGRRGRVAIGGEYLGEHRQVVASVLNNIPAHDQPPLTIPEIARRVARRFHWLPMDCLEPTAASIVVVLMTFEALLEAGGRYRCRAEIPSYFLRSLASYVGNNQTVASNWERRGVGDDLPINSLLDTAPYLLKLMEARRFASAGAHAEPIRQQGLVCILTRTIVDGQSHFLFEWDRDAAQYQLIGGRIVAGEEPTYAAIRQFQREIVVDDRRLEPGDEFEIVDLEWERPPPHVWTAVSRTVGALTRYEVWAYGAHLKMGRLRLNERYRWLSIPEMVQGHARNRRTSDPGLFWTINANLAGGLDQAPLSILAEAIQDLGS